MKKYLISVIAFSVLLLVPVGVHEAFAGVSSGAADHIGPAVGPIGDMRCWVASTQVEPAPLSIGDGVTSILDQFGDMPNPFIEDIIEYCVSADKDLDLKGGAGRGRRGCHPTPWSPMACIAGTSGTR